MLRSDVLALTRNGERVEFVKKYLASASRP